MNTRLLTLKEAAGYLGISTRTLRRWISVGKVRVVRLTARSPRIALKDLETFVEGSRDGK